MDEKKSKVPGAENPEKFTGIKRGKVKKSAGGLPAVASTLMHTVAEAGVFRGLKALSQLNKKGGFDCPSCAWPDPDDERSRLGEYCENGAKAVAEEATLRKLTRDFFASNSVQELSTLSDLEIGKMGRIAQPVLLRPGKTHYEEISWEDAFSRIGDALNNLKSPNEAIFYTSGRTSNEAAFLYQLFVREFGTNNLPDCSNMCHESSGVALGESLGIGKGSVKLEDFYQAEAIIILGQNPGTNHPRMLSALQKAKKNGATILSINPLPEAGLMGFNNPQQLPGLLGSMTPLTDIFLQVRINGDLALLQALELLLIEEDKKQGGVLDHEFIGLKTQGWESFKSHLESQDVQDLADASGVPLEKIRETLACLKNKKKIIACWAMGLTQHRNAVDTIKEIVNLLLMKGSIGKPGAGTCPVRGHSNVQGDRTVGISERPTARFLKSIGQTFGFTPPQEHGFDVVESIKAMHDGRAKIFFALGGNFLSAAPDTTFTANALKRCKLTVHVSTKLNRSHLVHGEEALILPCLGRSDEDRTGGAPQFVSCENSMSVVQSSRGVLSPVSNLLMSEPAIVCRLAKATLGKRSKVNWDRYITNYDFIRDEIERSIPGFQNYNERIRKPGGFYLPNGNREQNFDTQSGKAQFNIAKPARLDLKENELAMMSIRSHDQFNTTIYGLDDRYRGIYNERRVIMMNSKDVKRLGFKDEDVVDIINEDDGIKRTARKFIIVEYPIALRCAATYFPEANVLVPISQVAEKSGTPVSKMVRIRLVKSSDFTPQRY